MPSQSSVILHGMQLVTNHKVLANGYIFLENEKIVAVGTDLKETDYPDIPRRSYGEDIVAVPGFIDIHIHGGYGVDVMDATPEVFETLESSLPSEGTTAYLATTITQEEENINEALNAAASFRAKQATGGAEMLGIHLEGPFINAKKKGAQPEEHIKNGDVNIYKTFQHAADDGIRIVTCAPELAGGTDLTTYLNETGVIPSIGHSDASYDEMEAAIAAGAKHVTHLYNGMRGFHHRDPGVVGAAFTKDELNSELIVDGLHSSPGAVAAAYRASGYRNLCLITDSMRAKGLHDGTYDLGGQEVTVQGEKATLADGTLASSIVTMDGCFRNMRSFTDATLPELAAMTSGNQAEALGISDRKGSLEPHQDGDIVLLNEALEVEETWCRGQLAFQDKER
ncbi:N-acetylglucosamine-6-phosphate deacetylase [Natribacillus halophilus]|uniref:N-acetylglucosamine-6-phosphate deacetylase n=1 Tax=Natribacillus halophilus TaxID=549003 RepID=A0A1G8S355_9BACI|nr:N-acetylglucosamine-6-phosphate deacetylase [Natribacillus halophilus]SDJ23657.1 N-acetylglucosamine 6-phosphate deacetylase [Natribacillus halophilus]